MIYDIWLSTLKCPRARKKQWLFIHKTAENVHKYLSESGELFDVELSLDAAKKILEDCERKGVHIHHPEEFGVPDYGELPDLLYCKGTWKKTQAAIGIVGARRCTDYGKRMTEELGALCARKNITVVSGMAKGVDSIAHTAALKNGGYTIAALGCGPDICYPSEHRGLYEEICKNGLIVSEFPPGVHATGFTFPLRNRLIAAFSDRVVVTEAGRKSGALITCERARYYGKPVFAFPGPYDSPESEGCNNLIYKGEARMYKRSDVFFEAQQLSLPASVLPSALPVSSPLPIPLPTVTTLPQQVMEYLSTHDKHTTTDILGAVLDLKPGPLYALITDMELDDLIRTEGENIWLL